MRAPIALVVEAMRPLPVEPFAGARGAVRGLSVVRGTAIPVVDLGLLLGGAPVDLSSGRFVTLRLGERRIALLVGGVLELRALDLNQLDSLPPGSCARPTPRRSDRSACSTRS